VNQNIKRIITQSELEKIINDLCRKIVKSKWMPDYVVGITRGGLIPAVMISHYFELPMYALQVSLRDNAANNESNLWMAEDAFGYDKIKKNILIVDDINDSGATINWIINDWQQNCLPNDPYWEKVWNNNVKFLTIVDNLSSNCKVDIDYTGVEVNKAENSVWIDFPYETWWK